MFSLLVLETRGMRPSTNVSQVQMLDAGCITYGLSLLMVLVLAPRVFFCQFLWISSHHKSNNSKISVSSGGSEQRASTWNYWCYLYIWYQYWLTDWFNIDLFHDYFSRHLMWLAWNFTFIMGAIFSHILYMIFTAPSCIVLFSTEML